MNNIFQLQATIEKVSTLANKCLSILIHTRDTSSFTPEELSQIFKFGEKEIWVAFKELEVAAGDLDIKDVDWQSKKSKHERLQSLCLAYKKLKTGKFEGAREMYLELMEQVSQQVLDKIRELEEGGGGIL